MKKRGPKPKPKSQVKSVVRSIRMTEKDFKFLTSRFDSVQLFFDLALGGERDNAEG